MLKFQVLTKMDKCLYIATDTLDQFLGLSELFYFLVRMLLLTEWTKYWNEEYVLLQIILQLRRFCRF